MPQSPLFSEVSPDRQAMLADSIPSNPNMTLIQLLELGSRSVDKGTGQQHCECSSARALVTLMPQVQVSVSGGVVTGPWSHDERKKELPCARHRAQSTRAKAADGHGRSSIITSLKGLPHGSRQEISTSMVPISHGPHNRILTLAPACLMLALMAGHSTSLHQ